MIKETKTRRVDPDITVLEIFGRLNLGNSLMAVESSIQGLIEQGVRKLVIDLAGLNSIDSSGIGMLMMSNGKMEQNGGKLRIAGAHGPVAKALVLAHVDRIAPLDADVESGCRQLGADHAATL